MHKKIATTEAEQVAMLHIRFVIGGCNIFVQ